MRHHAQDRVKSEKRRDKKRDKSWVLMDELSQQDSTGKDATMRQEEVGAEGNWEGNGEGSANGRVRDGSVEELGDGHGLDEGSRPGRRRRRSWLGRNGQSYSHAHFRVYKRRWFGLAQLVLLNVVVSWDVCVSVSAAFFLSCFPVPAHGLWGWHVCMRGRDETRRGRGRRRSASWV